MDPELWKEKQEAVEELNPLLREQFVIQLQRFNLMMDSLTSSGFLDKGSGDVQPIRSNRKEKSGVLLLEIADHKWKKCYFVLFEGTLFYYKDSKAKSPTGFITLKYASIHLDTKRLMTSKFVFQVRTPLRIVNCKCKHAVALSEWMAVLENAINEHMKKKG